MRKITELPNFTLPTNLPFCSQTEDTEQEVWQENHVQLAKMLLLSKSSMRPDAHVYSNIVP